VSVIVCVFHKITSLKPCKKMMQSCSHIYKFLHCTLITLKKVFKSKGFGIVICSRIY
jgi:hypothetical protein